jgi:hypothetical protein
MMLCSAEATTNLLDEPIGINWLDGGAEKSLRAFLKGDSDTVVTSNTTNQQ